MKFAPGAPLFDRAIDAVYPTGSTSSRSPRSPRSTAASSRPGRSSTTPARFEIGEQVEAQRQGRRLRPDRPVGRAEGLLGHLLLHARRVGSTRRGRSSSAGPRVGLGRRTGIDLPSEPDGPRSRTPTGATGYRRYQRCIKRAGLEQAARPRCSAAAGSTGRGRRATTSTSRSARATCRPRRCRWPWPTPRSPTAARSCARTSPTRSRTARAASCRSCGRSARRKVELDPGDRDAILDGLRRAAGEPDGTSADVMSGLAKRGITVYGKTGTWSAVPASPTSPGTPAT